MGSPLLGALIHGQLERLMGSYGSVKAIEETAREDGTVHQLHLTSSSADEPDLDVWVVMGDVAK